MVHSFGERWGEHFMECNLNIMDKWKDKTQIIDTRLNSSSVIAHSGRNNVVKEGQRKRQHLLQEGIGVGNYDWFRVKLKFITKTLT